MPLTVEQILAHEERLKQEIAEKRLLLEVCQLFRSQMATHNTAPPAAADTSKSSVESTSAPATAPPTPARKIHPDLAAIYARSGDYGEIVAWAIKQMTDDYSVADIASLLRREDSNISGAQISGVLSRLKGRGEIEEIRQGHGRRGSIFRKPGSAISLEGASTDQTGTPVPTGDESVST